MAKSQSERAWRRSGIAIASNSVRIESMRKLKSSENGTAAQPNDGNGVDIESGSDGDLIGGTLLRADRNVIAGNFNNGIFVNTAKNTVIQDNYIAGRG